MKNSLLLILLFTSFCYSQKYSIGINSLLTTNVDEKQTNIRSSSFIDRNSISMYNNGIKIRCTISKIQMGLIATYGQQSFNHIHTQYYEDSLQIKEVDQHSKRELKMYSLKYFIQWQMYKHNSFSFWIGGLVDWSNLYLKDNGDYWINLYPDEFYNYSDTDKKGSLFIEPVIDLQFKFFSMLEFDFSVSYSFKSFKMSSERDVNFTSSFVHLVDPKFKYSFEGLYFGVGILYLINGEHIK
ncbi:MAG: hypothetical protein JXR46_00970 [Calditrichaceae bacterium]|nr:hypothetical protein [Calditrichaceae bacterium]MBN2707587.1 hypothetical protein [Calditrichaceae bacterium]RQV97776.1 MAG: hypothetical protein EH224_00260 [Calditrichota bacterium]